MASIILPNQLFHKPVEEDKKYLVEHSRYFTDFNFHRKKLILHRASMKAYSEKFNVEYIEYDQNIGEIFKKEDKIRMYDPVDHKLRNQLEGLAEKHDTELNFEENPGFMASMDFNHEYFSSHEYFQLNYYKTMRKKHNVLVDEDGKPEGGKWSFDPENRKKMPEDIEKPEIPQFSSEHVEEAKAYIEENFPDNPGKVKDFFWPVTREQALENPVNVSATVIDTSIEESSSRRGGIDYRPEIRYEYTFEGETYTSSNMHPGGQLPDEHNAESEAREVIDRYSQGSEITVFVSSQNPEQAFIEAEKTSDPLFFIGIGALFMTMGAYNFLKTSYM